METVSVAPETELKVSVMAENLIGSEIIKLAGEINEKIPPPIKFKVNYDSEIYFMGHNPFLNPEGNTFVYPEFDEIMVHFRSHFLQMHNEIEPANSIISLETVNKYEHRILQRKLIFLLINVINRTDFDYIVRIIEEETLKEKIKPIPPYIYSGKIIPVK